MVASLSLLPDIKWFMDFMAGLFDDSQGSTSSGQTGVARAGRASRAGTRAGRIVRLIRLVRLLRVVNIAKFFSREEQSALDVQNAKSSQHLHGGLHPSHSTSPENNRKGGEKRVEASRLGKILSEQTTRTVILGVLCMMLVLPMIEIEETNLTPQFGLEQIFWMGRSSCSSYKDFISTGKQNDVELNCGTASTPIAANSTITNWSRKGPGAMVSSGQLVY